jgi:hypothetical protein
MANIKVYLRDGTIQEFKHEGRPGGSYTKTVKYEGGFVIITDEWRKRTCFPADLVLRVEDEPTRW